MIMAALPAKLAPTVRPGDRVVYRTDAGEGSARVIGLAQDRGWRRGAGPAAIESGAPLPGSIVALRFGGQDARGAPCAGPARAIQTSRAAVGFVYRSTPRIARPCRPAAELTGADARVSGPLARTPSSLPAVPSSSRTDVQIAKPGV
jgi:hypothetical protein